MEVCVNKKSNLMVSNPISELQSVPLSYEMESHECLPKVAKAEDSEEIKRES